MSYRAKKRLGQNFLVDNNVLTKIASLVRTNSGLPLVEIGPGKGALTSELAPLVKELTAVEFDDDVIRHLTKTLKSLGNVKLVQGDFLKYEPESDKILLVGNIPYNITSPVIDWCINHRDKIAQVVLMVQKELADRITAGSGNRNWSPLSIMSQLFFETKLAFLVGPEAFDPPPKVTSAVIELTPRDSELPEHFDKFEFIVRLAFWKRRKQLINNLVPEIVPTAELMKESLDSLGFDRRIRAEQMSIDDFLKLTELIVDRNLI